MYRTQRARTSLKVCSRFRGGVTRLKAYWRQTVDPTEIAIKSESVYGISKRITIKVTDLGNQNLPELYLKRKIAEHIKNCQATNNRC